MPVLPAVDVSSYSPVSECAGAIQYCGPVFDPSGYAEFARGFVKAVHALGVPVCLEVVTFVNIRPGLGADRQVLLDLQDRQLKCCAKVINTPPDCFAGFRDPDCVNIGFTMSETTHIPASWVRQCNTMDGILVPCTWNREVFEQSGVRVPVRVVTPGMDAPPAEELASQDVNPTIPAKLLAQAVRRTTPHAGSTPSSPGDQRALWPTASLADCRERYKFYSLFQWTERKNPGGLLRAYLAEFRQTDNVCLILKTYRGDFGTKEQSLLLDEIASIRDSANLPDHAPILLISELLSQEQIRRLHRFGDCFVLPHRAERGRMPHMESMDAWQTGLRTVVLR